MTTSITRLATVVLILFGALFVNLNVIQLIRSDELATHTANRRLIIREYQIERGPLIVGEEPIAESVASDGELKYLRTYPDGPLYAHLTGYYSFILQRAGLEAALNEQLTGRSTEMLAQNLGELLGAQDRAGNSVELTIDPAGQEAARAALGDRVGAIVAVDPQSGAVLTSYANPTYDPNPLSSHDPAEIREAWDQLREHPDRPLVDRVTRDTFPPGSTFKILVAAAALERGLAPDTSFPDEDSYTPPQTSRSIRNFSGTTCGEGASITLDDSFRVSCNTVFARLGVELGADTLREQAERFGFNNDVPYELPVVDSSFPEDMDDPATAQSALGQRDVRATPLQMALVAATIANGGQTMRPHVVQAIRDPSGRQLRGPDVGPWRRGGIDGQAVASRTADQLRDMMITAVDDGTGRRAQIDGVTVGGKTGTAQVEGSSPTAWFVGFAEQRVAIAVVIPDAGDDATGGQVAAPIARDVMAALLGAD